MLLIKCEQKLSVAGTNPKPTWKVCHCQNFCSVLVTSAEDFLLGLHESSKRPLAFLHHFPLLPPHTFYGVRSKFSMHSLHICALKAEF